MEKYYTPEIGEFHVGFEFESNYVTYSKDGEWTKVVLKEDLNNEELSWFFTSYKGDAVPTEFRVKHLDREDVESLGFEIPKGGLDYVYKKSVGEVYYMLITNPNYPYKIEIRCSHPSWEYGNYLGIIKNKSELKKVLKMIGV